MDSVMVDSLWAAVEALDTKTIDWWQMLLGGFVIFALLIDHRISINKLRHK